MVGICHGAFWVGVVFLVGRCFFWQKVGVGVGCGLFDGVQLEKLRVMVGVLQRCQGM